ncbi:MAG: type VI secretion system tube protein Hcp [Phycisphaerales bacterium]|nr:MAG: type VI secretion system tube protein Hcp [Phycisphaerales bacterium]
MAIMSISERSYVMPAYMKIGSIQGEATEKDHKDWILVQSMSSPISRTIPSGAKDQQRTKGETILGDVVVVRDLDKSSPKLAEACANGTFFPEVEISFCTQVKNKQEPYLTYKLKDVIVSSYNFHGNAKGDPIPTEQVSLAFSEIEWNYVVVDPRTGDPKGNVPARYSPGEGHS